MMSKSTRQDRRPKADTPIHFRKRVPLWLQAALLVMVLGSIGVGVWAMNRPSRGSGIAPAPATPAQATTTSRLAIPADVRQHLVGRWLRPDGGYVMTVKNIGEDGKVDAAYNNPRAINVAKAEVTQDGGKASLHVELRDRLYPGNYYTLTYDPVQDRLVGDYHHLGIGQTLDVSFERLR
jgi:hypothetical protein